MKYLWFVLAVVTLGMAGLYGWYGSLHPCDMLIKDIVRTRGGAAAHLEDVLRVYFAPFRMTPGECAQALARQYISPNEPQRLQDYRNLLDPPAIGEELQRLQDYRNLLDPPAKGDAPAGEPGYNTRERDEMQRAFEGIGGSGGESQ